MDEIIKSIKELHEEFEISGKDIVFSDNEKTECVKNIINILTEYNSSQERGKNLKQLVEIVISALCTIERQNMLDGFEDEFKKVMTDNISHANKVCRMKPTQGAFFQELEDCFQ